MHEVDFEAAGFEWIDCHDSSQSVLSYLRKDQAGGQVAVALFNFTPVPRNNYRIGVPLEGFYREAVNSDAQLYGGSNVGNQGGVRSEAVSWMGRPYSVPIHLPPLGGLVLVYEPPQGSGEQAAADEVVIDEELDADAE